MSDHVRIKEVFSVFIIIVPTCVRSGWRRHSWAWTRTSPAHVEFLFPQSNLFLSKGQFSFSQRNVRSALGHVIASIYSLRHLAFRQIVVKHKVAEFSKIIILERRTALHLLRRSAWPVSIAVCSWRISAH
jgi:hypothetical protein